MIGTFIPEMGILGITLAHVHDPIFTILLHKPVFDAIFEMEGTLSFNQQVLVFRSKSNALHLLSLEQSLAQCFAFFEW